MKYFVIEGSIQHPELMDQKKLQEHMTYTQKAMDQGLILFSGLKDNQSGGIFVMKSDSEKTIDSYLANEPFFVYGIQTYCVTGFDPHYVTQTPGIWFER